MHCRAQIHRRAHGVSHHAAPGGDAIAVQFGGLAWGFQIAHKMLMFQWQDGKKAIVWPEELAPVKARFPTPPWSQR